MKRACLRAFAVAAGLAAAPVAAGADATRISLVGSELVLSVDGVPRPPSDLEGATLTVALEDGQTAEVRIDRITVDPHVPAGDVFLYDLSVADGGGWTSVCEPEADGKPHAVLQPTREGGIAVFCTAGAFGKCIRFGYRPWASYGGENLDVYWKACVKMVRADYCGDDQPTTRDNMLIDYYDRLGLAGRDNRPDLSFEAAWDENGAVCVAHSRVPQKMTLDGLAETCPRLVGRLGAGCTDATAGGFGEPLLFNASRGNGIPERVDQP